MYYTHNAIQYWINQFRFILSTKQKILLFGTSLLMMSATEWVVAQPTDDKKLTIADVVAMNVETLLEVEVVVIEDADDHLKTNTTYIFTEEDIYTNGFSSLEDILSQVPGVTFINNGFTLSSTQRGVQGAMPKLLLKVDGIEMRSLFDKQVFISHQLRSNNVRKIEIYAGPDGATQGDGAFAGVIHIFTKSGTSKDDFVEAYIVGGSNTTLEGGIGFKQTFRNKKSENLGEKKRKIKLSGSLGYYQTKGYDFSSFIEDENRFADQYPEFANRITTYENEGNSLKGNLSLDWNGVYIGGILYQNYSGNKGLQHVSLNYANQNKDERQFYDYYMGWYHRFNSKHFVNLQYQRSNEQIEGQTNNYRNNLLAFDNIYNQNQQTTALTDSQINDEFTLTYNQVPAGGSSRQRIDAVYNTFLKQGLNFYLEYRFDRYDLLDIATIYEFTPRLPIYTPTLPLAEPFKYNKHSINIQIEKAFFKNKLLLIGGGRYVSNDAYNNNGVTAFKAGVIYHPRSGTYLKAFFNQGFEEPNIYQINHQTDITNRLRAAQINNVEVNFIRQWNRVFRSSIALYRSEVKHAFTTLNNAWINQQMPTNVTGLETLFWYKRRRMKMNLGYAYNSKDFQDDVYNQTLLGSLSYRITPNIIINTNFRHYPNLDVVQHGNPSVVERISFENYTIINATISSKYIQRNNFAIRFLATVKNIQDKVWYQPNLQNTGPRQYQQMGRYFEGKITVRI